jgi:hypothetical protein
VHTRVVSVETRDGLASWTLAGQVASSNDQTRDCDRLAAATTDTGGAETKDTGAAETKDTGAAETTDTGAAETTDTGAAETTDTGGAGAGTDGCAAGERLADGECEPVQAVRLLFVDNVMECDGHAVARFAAVNDNPFRLDEATFASTLSPQRLDGDQVTVLERHDEASDDNALAAEFLTVRYITSVTWTVTHHGLKASVSAGVSGATPNPDCPLAAVNATGADGLLATPGTIPTTGTHDVVPIWLIASMLLLSGMVLIVAAGRRRPDDERTADV